MVASMAAAWRRAADLPRPPKGARLGLFSAFFFMRLLDHSGNPLASAHIFTMADDKDPASVRQKSVAEAAKRANAEAEARRKTRAAVSDKKPSRKETGGQAGLEPTRYGDWEKDGIISDF